MNRSDKSKILKDPLRTLLPAKNNAQNFLGGLPFPEPPGLVAARLWRAQLRRGDGSLIRNPGKLPGFVLH